MPSLDRLSPAAATPAPAISLVHSEPATTSKISQIMLAPRVRIAALCLLPICAVAETVFGRHAMNPDGVSYLDLGDAMMRGDWKMAVNGHWSPLYPLLQGLALKLFRPSSYAQFTVVHFVNFLIFLFALACFDMLLRTAIANRPGRNDFDRVTNWLPEWAVLAVGYSVFLWSSLSLTMMWRVSPDMLMAGFLYLAVALLLRIWAEPRSFSGFILLGAVLGLGYLAKAPFFPLAFVFLALAGLLAGGGRRATPRVLGGLLVFAIISGPWVVALSQAKGRFMFGDSGRLNQVLWVDGASPSYYFLNLGTAGGHYTHPIRQIFNSPPIYEFASPIKGTLPVWTDPSYWSDGAVPRISIKKQLSVLIASVAYYIHLLFSSQAALFVGFAVLCFMGGRDLILKQVRVRWPVWVVGLVGLGMYALVHVELRYLAAFLTLFWVGLFSGLEMPSGREGRRLAALVTLAVVIVMAGPTLVSVAAHLRTSLSGRPNTEWQVADNLRRMGVTAGDRVARVGGGFGAVYWARLAGVSVVAEVPGSNSMEFWYAKPEVKAQAIETFRQLGVTAIVADLTEQQYVPGPEWQKLGNGYFALRVGGNARNLGPGFMSARSEAPDQK